MSGEVASTVVMFMSRFTKINRLVKRHNKPSACYKWVPVTSAWLVLKLRMEERLPIWRVAANILNKKSRIADEVWYSRRVGLCEVITYRKNVSCYEMFTRKASDLDGYFGSG
jgi:hypothetical protein